MKLLAGCWSAIWRMIAVGLFTLISVPLLAGETAVERGLAIFMEADRRDTGFGDTSADM